MVFSSPLITSWVLKVRPVACSGTATTIGGIKISRGLDIAPDGTASAGVYGQP